jgi:hypothetical protein
MENTPDPVYSGHVIEFTAVANEFCKYAEHAGEMKGEELLNIMQRLLPLLYLKASFLPSLEPVFEDGNEKFVTEGDWIRIRSGFRSKLRSADDYLEIADDKTIESDGPVVASLSEDMADIYQDMKNFILLYQTGTNEVMNDAVWECRMNFENFWGYKLVNALKAIHHFIYSGSEITNLREDEENDTRKEHPDWFISKRQNEFRKDEQGI